MVDEKVICEGTPSQIFNIKYWILGFLTVFIHPKWRMLMVKTTHYRLTD